MGLFNRHPTYPPRPRDDVDRIRQWADTPTDGVCLIDAKPGVPPTAQFAWAVRSLSREALELRGEVLELRARISELEAR